jgi:CBS domain-containing protein
MGEGCQPKAPLRRAEQAGIEFRDSAVRVVSDATHQTLWTVSADSGLALVLEAMSRLSVPAFLVMREREIVGLITFEDIRRARAIDGNANRVADVMTDAGHIPMIDWQTVLESNVSDLLQIFESTHVNHLMVVESENSAFTRVLGVVYRRQLLRRLGVFPILDRGMESALAAMPLRSSAFHVMLDRSQNMR